METSKKIERSVDSLQRIYSIILALSLGQAINIALLDPTSKQLASSSMLSPTSPDGVIFFTAVLPITLAFFATLIPFHQGMNRHLDFHYVEHGTSKVRASLLLDFIFFVIEGALFFAIASSVRQPDQAFVCFGILLIVDIIWALIARLIHPKSENRPIAKWPGINFIALFGGVLILAFTFVDVAMKPWLLFLLSLSRTTVDYVCSLSFYFPFEDAPTDEV